MRIISENEVYISWHSKESQPIVKNKEKLRF